MDIVIKTLDKIIEISLFCLIFIIPFSKAGIEIFAIIAISGWILKKALEFRRNGKVAKFLPKTPLNAPVFALFIISFASMIVSIDIGLGLEGLISKLGEYILLFFISVEIFSKKEKFSRRFNIFLGIVMASALLLFIDGLFQWITGRDFVRGFSPTPRLRASFSNENDFAGFIIAILPILFCTIFIMLEKAKITLKLVVKFISIALFLVGIVLLSKTFARGAWFGYLLSMIFLGTVGFLARKKILLAMMVGRRGVFSILAILFVLIPLISGFLFIEPIKKRLTGPSGNFGIIVRTYQWRKAIAMIEDFPILGTGPNSYTAANAGYSGSGSTGAYPHNSYLHIAVEIGILGLMAFLWMLWRFFYIGIKFLSGRYEYSCNDFLLVFGIMAGALATLGQSFFDTNLFALRLITLFWIMLGIGTAYSIVVSNKSVEIRHHTKEL